MVIDLSQDDDEERPFKKAKRNERSLAETISSSPAAENSSPSNRPTPQSDSEEIQTRKINTYALGNRAIPAEAKRAVAMAILYHGIDGINRAELSAEVSLQLVLVDDILIGQTGLTSKQINQLVRKEGTVWRAMVAAALSLK